MNVNFGNGQDVLTAANWSYSWSGIWLNGGNDVVDLPSNAQTTNIFGGTGADTMFGSSNLDVFFGGDQNDYLNGRNGNDYLFGDAGHDTLVGGQGRDYLQGGFGADSLTGGSEGDYFNFRAYDSLNAAGYRDVIQDWDVRYDYITTNVAGTAANYGEYQTNSVNMDQIGAEIFNSSWRTTKDHVFAYNPSSDTGYLFSDLNADNYFDNAVIIRGAGSASDMNYSDIIV